jgi:hypothetical protein
MEATMSSPLCTRKAVNLAQTPCMVRYVYVHVHVEPTHPDQFRP